MGWAGRSLKDLFILLGRDSSTGAFHGERDFSTSNVKTESLWQSWAGTHPSGSSHTALSPPTVTGLLSGDSQQPALFFSPLNYPEKKKKTKPTVEGRAAGVQLEQK